MANSNYYDAVTRCAKEVGIQPPISTTQFDDDAQLPSPLLKLKLYFDKCQRILIRTLNKKFTERLYTFNTSSGTNEYPLDSMTNIEGVAYHSVRCNTTGANRPLFNMTYNAYRELYTDLSLVPTGKPTQWVSKITPAASGAERVSTFIILPIPDGIYEIEYAAKISAIPLVTHDDIILFPPEYEDVLWTWAEAMLESKLGVDATAENYAQNAVDQCRMWAERAIDEKRGVKMGVKMRRTDVSGSRYDYPDFSRGWDRW